MAKRIKRYVKPPAGHTPDPLRRLKLQMQMILGGLGLKSARRIAHHYNLKTMDVRGFFDPRAEITPATLKVLTRIATELGLELVLCPLAILDPIPAEAENTLFHPVPSKYDEPMAGFKTPKGIYDHLPTQE